MGLRVVAARHVSLRVIPAALHIEFVLAVLHLQLFQRQIVRVQIDQHDFLLFARRRRTRRFDLRTKIRERRGINT